jgi:hypothetical protein
MKIAVAVFVIHRSLCTTVAFPPFIRCGEPKAHAHLVVLCGLIGKLQNGCLRRKMAKSRFTPK